MPRRGTPPQKNFLKRAFLPLAPGLLLPNHMSAQIKAALDQPSCSSPLRVQPPSNRMSKKESPHAVPLSLLRPVRAAAAPWRVAEKNSLTNASFPPAMRLFLPIIQVRFPCGTEHADASRTRSFPPLICAATAFRLPPPNCARDYPARSAHKKRAGGVSPSTLIPAHRASLIFSSGPPHSCSAS